MDAVADGLKSIDWSFSGASAHGIGDIPSSSPMGMPPSGASMMGMPGASMMGMPGPSAGPSIGSASTGFPPSWLTAANPSAAANPMFAGMFGDASMAPRPATAGFPALVPPSQTAEAIPPASQCPESMQNKSWPVVGQILTIVDGLEKQGRPSPNACSSVLDREVRAFCLSVFVSSSFNVFARLCFNVSSLI